MGCICVFAQVSLFKIHTCIYGVFDQISPFFRTVYSSNVSPLIMFVGF